jgi:hypothetical protein
MKESLLQDKIRLALGRVPGLVLWRNNCGYDGDRRVRYGVGSPGGADLIGVLNGRFVAVEIKTPTGRQSPDQKRFAELVESKGGEYVILRSIEDAEAWVSQRVA